VLLLTEARGTAPNKVVKLHIHSIFGLTTKRCKKGSILKARDTHVSKSFGVDSQVETVRHSSDTDRHWSRIIAPPTKYVMLIGKVTSPFTKLFAYSGGHCM
jgi:ribosomal protein RSM22 (predicted rRNA methylase)